MNNNIKVTEQGITVSIQNIPECIIKARLMYIVKNPNAKICVVARQLLPDGTWVAYAGYPDVRELKSENGIESRYRWFCQSIRDRKQVVMLGDLLPFNVATELFPDWD